MTMPLWILGMLLNQLQKGEAASRRVFAVIDLEPSIYDKEDALPLEEPIEVFLLKMFHSLIPPQSQMY